MSLTKNLARKVLLPAAMLAGADKILKRRIKKNCCIVNFHGVRSSTATTINNRHMPVREFEKLIRYLKKNYDIVPLADLFVLHREKRTPKQKTIALTFDDGYRNNFDVALPVLKKYQTPATFYIITKALTEPDYLSWPDIIDILKTYQKSDIEIDGHIFPYPSYDNKELATDVIQYIKTQGIRADKIAYRLMEGNDYIKRAMREFPELVQLGDAAVLSKHANETLVEFGAHSHSHPCMEYLTVDEAGAELLTSKKILEETINKPVKTFAYPDGSYNPETLKITKKAGFSNIVAVNYKFNEKNSDPNLLSRFTISNSTTMESNALRLAKDFDRYGF